MSDLTLKMSSQNEATRRISAEREMAILLVPEKWNELKSRFRLECSEISKHCELSFECREPDKKRFEVCKIVSGTSLPAIGFQFHPSIPAISFRERLAAHGGAGTIAFALAGQVLHFSIAGTGIFLDEFVQQQMMPLVGQ